MSGKLCRKCRKRRLVIIPQSSRMGLCEQCFSEYFVNRVARTIKEYRMLDKEDRVAIAISGGKDSVSLLHAFKRAFDKQEVVAIHINLGIKGYSDHCEEIVRKLAKSLDTDLMVYDLRKEEGISIDDYSKTQFRKKICSPCGAIKRQIFNVLAHEARASVLATGHNLDDMVSTMLQSLISGDLTQLARLEPVLPSTHPKLPKKIKPLIKTPEDEDLYYACFNDLPFRSAACPHSTGGPYWRGKEMLRHMEKVNRNVKYQLLSVFTKKLIPLIKPTIEQVELKDCSVCGYPSSAGICAKCKRVLIAKSQLAS